MKVMIAGYGDTGKAVHKIVYDADIVDFELGYPPIYEPALPRYEVILMCIPYLEKFEIIARNYYAIYKPEAIIVFSDIPVEVCEDLGLYKCTMDGIVNVHPIQNDVVNEFLSIYFGIDD